jgi:hypothetical protein
MAFGSAIVLPALNRVFESTESIEVWETIKDGFLGFMSGDATLDEVYQSIVDGYNKLVSLMQGSHVPATFWTTIVVIYIMSCFVVGTSNPIIADIYHNFMSSNMEYGFLSNLIKNLRRSVRYSAGYTLVSVPLDVVIFFATFGIVAVLFPLLSFFSLMVGLFVSIVLVSMKIALFSGVLPEMIVENKTESFFKAFKASWPVAKKNFKDFMYSVSLALFVFYSAIAVTAIITFGISFFVLTSMAICFINVLELTYYYGAKNMRYYTDASTIVNTAPITDRIDLQDELLIKDK